MAFQIVNGKKHFSDWFLKEIQHQHEPSSMTFLNGVDIKNSTDCTGKTLLHLAAAYNNYSLAEHLITHGVNIDAEDETSTTPLLVGVLCRSRYTVEVLLRANADIHRVNKDGWSPLSVLPHVEANQPIMTYDFLESIESSAVDTGEVARILVNAKWPLSHVLITRNCRLVQLMAMSGCSVDVRTPWSGNSLLHMAVQLHDVDMVKVLIECGADVNLGNNQGELPIGNFILVDECPEILELLLVAGADLYAVDVAGRLQVCNIFRYGNHKAVELLLKYGVDVNRRDRNNQSILHYAAYNKRRRVFDLLREQDFECLDSRDDAGVTPLHVAATRLNVAFVEFLLEKSMDRNCGNSNGWTPLHLVAGATGDHRAEEREICARLLLDCGADVNVECDSVPKTPLQIALRHGHSEVADMLLSHIVRLDVTGSYVSNENRAAICSDTYAREYYSPRREQLLAMRDTLIYGNVSFLDLFIAAESKVSIFARNRRLVAAFDRSRYATMFPLYGNALGCRMRRGVFKRRVLQTAARVISESMRICGADNLIIDKILYYLNDQDLHRLV